MEDPLTFYALLSCLAMELLYLLSDYYIYRSKNIDHKGLLDYIHTRFRRSTDTIPSASPPNADPPT